MGNFDGAAYQARFDALAAEGMDVHGEARLVRSLKPTSVLDAGCGTGRVAIELARHGIEVVGVDLDASMIAEARRLAPELELVEADLAELDLRRVFDLVLLAGNVPLFCPRPRRDDLVRRCAAHVAPDGVLIAGFQLGRSYLLADFDASAAAGGLLLEQRWSSWEGADFEPGSTYVVSLLRRPV